jgi:hypothetical protein
MKLIRFLLLAGLALSLVSCGSSPQNRKDRAEAELTEETTKTMQEYQSCVKKAKDDQQQLETCERLLKAIQTQ